VIFRVKHSVILVQVTVSFPLPMPSTHGSQTLSVSQVILCTPNGSAPYCEAPCASQVGPTDGSCVLCYSGRLHGVSEFVFWS